jgi:hypothetical protein
MFSRGRHTTIFIISMFMLLLLKDLLIKFIITYEGPKLVTREGGVNGSQ